MLRKNKNLLDSSCLPIFQFLGGDTKLCPKFQWTKVLIVLISTLLPSLYNADYKHVLNLS